ncbi:MAG: hypothetical protein HW421_569 [Ignavibacteria bacterium]|nr:hypothetical protein [Ignavibacteria bacterium]
MDFYYDDDYQEFGYNNPVKKIDAILKEISLRQTINDKDRFNQLQHIISYLVGFVKSCDWVYRQNGFQLVNQESTLSYILKFLLENGIAD